MAVGPSDLDHSIATAIVAQWATIGLKVNPVDVSSDLAAAVATATNNDDLAVFTRPTITAVSYVARSWSGPGYADAFPSGWRTVAVTKLFNRGDRKFQPGHRGIDVAPDGPGDSGFVLGATSRHAALALVMDQHPCRGHYEFLGARFV